MKKRHRSDGGARLAYARLTAKEALTNKWRMDVRTKIRDIAAQKAAWTRQGVFDRLEEAGKIPLCDLARHSLAVHVVGYQWVAIGQRVERPALLRRRREAASSLSCTADLIESLLLGNLEGDMPTRLRELAVKLAKGPLPGRGRRRRDEDDDLIVGLADIFTRSGGNAAVSPACGGPFTEFLRQLWELLPEDVRIKNVDTFLRRAQLVLLRHRREPPRILSGAAALLRSEHDQAWQESIQAMHASRATNVVAFRRRSAP